MSRPSLALFAVFCLGLFVWVGYRVNHDQAAAKRDAVAYYAAGNPTGWEEACLHSVSMAKLLHKVPMPGCHDAVDGLRARVAFASVDRGWAQR